MNRICNTVRSRFGKQPEAIRDLTLPHGTVEKTPVATARMRVSASIALAVLLALSASPLVHAASLIGDATVTGYPTESSGTGSNSNGATVANTCPYFLDRGNPGNNAVDSTGHMMEGACGVAVGNKATVHVAADFAGAVGTGGGGVAIGDRAAATSGVAIGAGAQSQNNSAISIGPISLATGNSAIAVGRQSAGTGDYSIAMGNVSWSEGDSSVAIGDSAHAQGYRSVAIGGADTQHSPGASNDGAGYDTDSQTFAGGDGAVAVGTGAKTSVDGSVALGADSVATTAAGVEGYDPATNATSTDTSATWKSTSGAVSVGDVDNDLTRQITGVAAGSADTDAVNVAQLKNLAGTLSNSGSGSGGFGLKAGDGNTVTQDLGKTITVKGDGRNISTSVVGGALQVGLNNDITVDSVTAGGTTVNNNGVTIVGGPSITTGGIDAGGQKITDVAPGTQGTDAVNVNQLNAAMQESSDWAKSYTDQRVNELSNKANAGIASAMAMASVPQGYAPNQSTLGVAMGSFRGESAIAIGVSTISDSGRYVLKVNATGNSRGDAGVGVGAAIVW